MSRDARTLRGASPALVREAIDDRDPLPGSAGFAGEVDGRLVRDVLGRQPLFSEADDRFAWSFDPADLDDPVRVPAGVVRGRCGDERVWTLLNPPAASAADALDAVRAAVRTSVRELDPNGLAVAFSGGVDSALVAAGAPDAPCYVAGFPDAHDVAAARAAAEAMGRDLRVVELAHADLERAIPAVVRATGRTNAMDVGIALPLYLVAERAVADGFDRVAVGQGADELFGGYAKVANAPDDHRVEAETVRGATREVIATLPNQLERDVLALRAAGAEPVAPLLHDRVVEAALSLPGPLLVSEGERKVALRRAGEGLIPESVATADKKAVQYGSLVSRELDRLARRAGFKRRMDDHVGRYVRSLIETDGV
ncbi:asparagine synthase C-terminal domain-containing protein [Halegenticoccus soli]|uniref:asparagine synthase C-terminal domain-containing protein n=1 Tax=Halegenticoccus soli TaxID=1985678 RepID=UPI000C6DB6E9|nr:asparagine synthase-related protein [Halegenticoccus soli]